MSLDKLLAEAKAWREDPVARLIQIEAQRQRFTPPPLYGKQKDAIYPPGGERDAYIEASTKSGKTRGCEIWIGDRAVNVAGLHWWVAPTYRQAKTAFDELRAFSWFKPFVINVIRSVPYRIELVNGSVIEFLSGDDPDNLYSVKVLSLVVDEASRLPDECFPLFQSITSVKEEGIKGRSPTRMIGNVTGKNNRFFDLCRLVEQGADKSGLNAAYSKIVAQDAVDAGYIEADTLKEAKITLSQHEYDALYNCIPWEALYKAFNAGAVRACVGQPSSKPVYAWGGDVAREGRRASDHTVIVGVDEDCSVVETHHWKGVNTVEQEQKIVGIVKPSGVAAEWFSFDATGYGKGMADHLIIEHFPKMKPFVFSTATKPPLMNTLGHAINTGAVRYPKEGYLQELLDYERRVHKSGYEEFTHPDGDEFHDDYLDALALAVEAHARRKAGFPMTWLIE